MIDLLTRRPGPAPSHAEDADLAARIDALDWSAIALEFERLGCTVIPALLSAPECDVLAALYAHDRLFRSKVVMAAPGAGGCKHFDHPLPGLVSALRQALYPKLVPLAQQLQGGAGSYPARLDDFIERGRSAGQCRPSPWMLRHTQGDHDGLHEALYGTHLFPLQATVLLSRPGRDFTGGDFLVAHGVARAPPLPRGPVRLRLGQGDTVLLAAPSRPVRGAMGSRCLRLRHGVQRLESGCRHAVGLLFHDAR